MFTYAEVERILATLHLQPQGRLPAFRARLKYLRRLGVPTIEGPGSGQRISYSKEALHQLAFCLELEAFGFDPTFTAVVAKHRWSKVYGSIFRRAEKHAQQDPDRQNDLFMVITPELIASSPETDVIGHISIRGCLRDDLVENEIAQMTDKAGLHTRRKCFLNVSDLVQRLRQLADQEAEK